MMARATRNILLDALLDQYQKLRHRLSYNLGSPDLASEALHETWIDLSKGGELAPVHNPDAYVFMAALNKARRLRKTELRHLNTVEIGNLLELADDAPGPERIAAGRSELAQVHRILDTLTKRQRIIFVECYLGDAAHRDLAERFGVTSRTVQNELREALVKVTRRMIAKDRFQSPPPRDSNK